MRNRGTRPAADGDPNELTYLEEDGDRSSSFWHWMSVELLVTHKTFTARRGGSVAIKNSTNFRDWQPEKNLAI